MPARVIGISHTMGAGGPAVGLAVAERLRFRYVDEDIVVMAAEKENLDPALVADVEQRKSFFARLFEDLGSVGSLDAAGAYGGVIAPGLLGDAPPASSEHYRDLIRAVIHETAEQGNVVIVSHAASIALAGRPDLLRVLVTAPDDTRARRVADERDIERKEAAKLVNESDSARAHYFKRFYELDRELPTQYDLVVSTEVLTPQQAAKLVAQAARSLE